MRSFTTLPKSDDAVGLSGPAASFLRHYAVTSVANAFAQIAPRLGALIRMLGSDRDGEALAAARAIGRVLKASGQDFHALAETIENAPHAVAPHAAPTRDEPDDLNWKAVAKQLLADGELSPREREFVTHMTRWRGRPTERQRNWLRALMERELENF
jgi:hypothetical protein